MNQAALSRPLQRLLAGLPEADREAVAALITQVQHALADHTPPAEIAAHLSARMPLPPAVTGVLIEALAHLAHPDMPAVLQIAFGDSSDKARQKALKKALHHLKTQGVAIAPEFTRPTGAAIVRPMAGTSAAKAYMSRIEGNGSRLLAIHLPGAGQSFNLLVALANDVEGLLDAYAVPMNNREVKIYLEQVKADIPGDLAVVDPAFALGVLEESFQIDPDQGEAAILYRQVRPLLHSRLGSQDWPDIQSFLPPLLDATPPQEELTQLILEDDFFNWTPSPTEIEPWVEKLAQAKDSPLHLTPEQQEARMKDIIQSACQALYPPEERRRLSRRLLHMTYYLDQTGRPHLARLAQAAGMDVARERSPLEPESPFLISLFLLPIQLAARMAAEKESEGTQPQGRIITEF